MAKEAEVLSHEVINGPGVGELVDALKYAYREQVDVWSGGAFLVDFSIKSRVPSRSGIRYVLRITSLRRDEDNPAIFHYEGETCWAVAYAVTGQKIWGTYDTRERAGTLNHHKN